MHAVHAFVRGPLPGGSPGTAEPALAGQRVALLSGDMPIRSVTGAAAGHRLSDAEARVRNAVHERLGRSSMDQNHAVAHGKHREKGRRRRVLVPVLLLAVLAGAVVVAMLWRDAADTNADGGSGTGSRASAAADQGSAPEHADGTPGGAPAHGGAAAHEKAPAPAPSGATPTVGTAVAVGKAPHHVAVAPDGRSAYIADPVAGAVIRFDTIVGRPTATIPIPQGPPQMVTLSPNGSRVYVSVYESASNGYGGSSFEKNHVVSLDTRTDSVVWAVLVGRGPYAAMTTADGGRLYLPFYDEDHLDVLDTATGELVTRIASAPSPHWITMSGDDRVGYVTNHFSDVVSVIELSSNTVVSTIPVGQGPHSLALSPDGTRVAVVNYISDDVSIIDTATNRVVQTVAQVGAGPQDVTYAPDGRHLYTANVDDGTVSVVDTATGTVTTRIPTGVSPTSVALLPDGRQALVTNFEDGTVRLIDTSSAG
jgi:YVTN family beta-propeller protein